MKKLLPIIVGLLLTGLMVLAYGQATIRIAPFKIFTGRPDSATVSLDSTDYSYCTFTWMDTIFDCGFLSGNFVLWDNITVTGGENDSFMITAFETDSAGNISSNDSLTVKTWGTMATGRYRWDVPLEGGYGVKIKLYQVANDSGKNSAVHELYSVQQ